MRTSQRQTGVTSRSSPGQTRRGGATPGQARGRGALPAQTEGRGASRPPTGQTGGRGTLRNTPGETNRRATRSTQEQAGRTEALLDQPVGAGAPERTRRQAQGGGAPRSARGDAGDATSPRSAQGEAGDGGAPRGAEVANYVYIANLPLHATASEIETSLQSEIGPIESVVMYDEQDGKSTFAYVTFSHAFDARKAIRTLHAATYQGRVVRAYRSRTHDVLLRHQLGIDRLSDSLSATRIESSQASIVQQDASNQETQRTPPAPRLTTQEVPPPTEGPTVPTPPPPAQLQTNPSMPHVGFSENPSNMPMPPVDPNMYNMYPRVQTGHPSAPDTQGHYARAPDKPQRPSHMQALQGPSHMQAPQGPSHMQPPQGPSHMQVPQGPSHLQAPQGPSHLQASQGPSHMQAPQPPFHYNETHGTYQSQPIQGPPPYQALGGAAPQAAAAQGPSHRNPFLPPFFNPYSGAIYGGYAQLMQRSVYGGGQYYRQLYPAENRQQTAGMPPQNMRSSIQRPHGYPRYDTQDPSRNPQQGPPY